MNITHLNITIIFILSKCLSLWPVYWWHKLPPSFLSHLLPQGNSRVPPLCPGTSKPWIKLIYHPPPTPTRLPATHTLLHPLSPSRCIGFQLLLSHYYFGFVFPPNWEAQGWQLTEKAQTKHSHRTSHTSSGHHKWTFRVVWSEAFLWHEKITVQRILILDRVADRNIWQLRTGWVHTFFLLKVLVTLKTGIHLPD